MFGRQAALPVDIILGARGSTPPADHTEFSKQTRNNLPLAFKLARRNLTEQAQKLAQAIQPLRLTQCSKQARIRGAGIQPAPKVRRTQSQPTYPALSHRF